MAIGSTPSFSSFFAGWRPASGLAGPRATLPIPPISTLWELFSSTIVLVFAALVGGAQSHHTYSDEDLVSDFRRGDRRAFDALVIRYQDKAFRFCLRYMGNRERAEEVAQETFVRVYRNLGSFRGDSSFSSWFYAVMHNHCRNRVKAATRRKERQHDSIDAPRSEEDPRGMELPDRGPGPEGLVGARERRGLIETAMAHLEPEQRALLILRELEGQSYEEISDALDVPLGTVKSRIYRARQALKQRVQRQMGGLG